MATISLKIDSAISSGSMAMGMRRAEWAKASALRITVKPKLITYGKGVGLYATSVALSGVS